MKFSDKKQIYLVGAAKAGTTSIAQIIGFNNNVVYNPRVKEPSFHARESLSKLNNNCKMVRKSNFILDAEEYHNLYVSDSSTFFVDASTCYLWYYQEVIKSIKEYSNTLDEVFIIIVLRNPYQRMYSQYLQMRMNEVEELSFDDALNMESERSLQGRHPFYSYSGYSLYNDPIRAYKASFPNVLVVDYDKLNNSPKELYNEIYQFLGLRSQESTALNFRGNKTGDKKRFSYLDYLLKNRSVGKIRKGIGKILGPDVSRRAFNKLNNFNIIKSDYDLSTINRDIVKKIEMDLSLCSEMIDCKFVDKWKRDR